MDTVAVAGVFQYLIPAILFLDCKDEKTILIYGNNQCVMSKQCEHMAVELDQMFGVFFLNFCIFKSLLSSLLCDGIP